MNIVTFCYKKNKFGKLFCLNNWVQFIKNLNENSYYFIYISLKELLPNMIIADAVELWPQGHWSQYFKTREKLETTWVYISMGMIMYNMIVYA